MLQFELIKQFGQKFSDWANEWVMWICSKLTTVQPSLSTMGKNYSREFMIIKLFTIENLNTNEEYGPDHRDWAEFCTRALVWTKASGMDSCIGKTVI